MRADAPMAEDLLGRLSAYLDEYVGLHLPREKWSEMERGIRSAARDFEFQDPASCVEWLLSSPLSRRQVEVLASHLTVGETYFFREKPTFRIFEERILPELVRSRRESAERIRVWSAGCATGEEPYSIAIELQRNAGEEISRPRSFGAAILATDINPRSLAKAVKGVYGEWSFREVPSGVKERYFRKKERGHEILPEIRKQVQFSFLNLAEDAYPSVANNTNAMDVIFCRNVLMYFSPGQARKVIQKFHRSLVDGGWLIVSPCEASADLFPEFSAVHYPGAIFYRKGAKAEVFDPASPCIPEFPAPRESNGCLWEKAAEEALPAHSFRPLGRPPLPPTAPSGSDSRLNQARKHYDQGRYTRVIEILEGGLDADQGPADLALKARAYANQGRLAEALAECDRAIARDKVHAGCHFLRATILIEQGALDDADQELKRLLYLDPDSVPGHLALSQVAHRQGRTEISARHLGIARRLLAARAAEEVVPEFEGMTSGRLLEIIAAQQGGPRSFGAGGRKDSSVQAARPDSRRREARKGGAR